MKMKKGTEMTVINKVSVEIDSPQDLRELADRFEAAAKNRTLPGKIIIAITDEVNVVLDPLASFLRTEKSNTRYRENETTSGVDWLNHQ